MRSVEDQIEIVTVGMNTLVYELKRKENVISTASEITMDGMITKVVILGTEDDDGKSAVETTVTGKTDLYGTLQKLQQKDEDTSVADARAEAEETIKEYGEPKHTFVVGATDIPWIRKGDKVKVYAGDMDNYFIVTSISHSITSKSKTMSIDMEFA